MMKLITDDRNINSLKIIATSEFCGLDITIERPQTNGDQSALQQLPLLLAENGSQYFPSNESCRYIFTHIGKEIDPTTTAWLEWEATIFQPNVFNCLDSQKGPNLSDDLKINLNYLNAFLKGKSSISQDVYGLSDIVLWSTVYPLFEIYDSKEVSGFDHIRKWFVKLNESDACKKAVERIFVCADKDFLKKSLSYQVVPLPSVQHKFFIPVMVPGFTVESFTSAVVKQEDDAKVYTQEEIDLAYETWCKGISLLPALKNKEPIKEPKEGEQNILITSALPYVNNVPHLGNIIGAVLSADVFARFCRLRNFNTLYVCGTDEYGTATETKAIERGVSPKEICDQFNKLHSEIYEWFNISFDHFGRTTTSQQTVIAQDIFKRLHSRDLLIEDTVEQLYCEKCERFLADRFVEGTCPFCAFEEARGDQCDKCDKLINAPELKNPACKLCKSTPHLRTSKHLFLDLPKIEPKLKEYLERSFEQGHWSNTAKVITSSWLKEGLKPRCITRDLKWGTPVPLEGYTDKVFYVWFDAPIGYLSITANYMDDWEKWWKQPDKVQLYQFMAKDNVPFHSIIFPACQLGADDNYTIINHLAATEYLNYEDMRFSKSRGIGVFGDDARNTDIPSDIWRFYLLYMRPETQDSAFSWNDLMLKNNSELLNNLGNFINRALMFISNNFDGVIPEMKLNESDKAFIAEVGSELRTYISFMEKTRLRDAIKPMLTISRIGNKYIQDHKPWVLIKKGDAERCIAGTILGISANVACLLATLMEPYMPETSEKLKKQLNTKPEFHVLIPEFVCLLAPGHKISKPTPLFRTLEKKLIDDLKVRYVGVQDVEKVKSISNKKASQKSPADLIINVVNEDEIERLLGLVTEQGNKVRELKAKKVEKSEIDQEVAVLLDLKKQLAISKGENPAQTKSKSKSKSKK